MKMHRKEFSGILMFMSGLCFGFVIPAFAQSFDTSGNAKLKGDYFVRQVITTDLDSITSDIRRAVSITGVMTFDGQGHYTFNGQKVDSASGVLAVPFAIASGTYAVESNGMAQIQNPIGVADKVTDMEYGAVAGVGPTAIVASATQGAYNDVFVAIQAGSGATDASLKGSYTLGFVDFLQANLAQVRDGYYTINSPGNGTLGNVSVTGAMASQNGLSVTQNYSGVSYVITGDNGAGNLIFPTATTPSTALVSGQKSLYVSADGNLLLGGDPNGFDLIVGVKSLSGSATNSLFQGTYYTAALELCDCGGIDSFYGSTLALGSQGEAILHERIAFFDSAAYDYSSDGFFNFAANGTSNEGIYQSILGAGGHALLQVGMNNTYSVAINLAAQTSQPGAVFIDPLSIFNAASYAPITNPVSPGEFVTIFGSGLAASTLSAQSLPLPKTLNNVQVSVNGRSAPLLFVSSTQINLLIPFATSEPYATIQVTNNNVVSNPVTVYTSPTTPGVFALTSLDGITYPSALGPAAVLHLDYTLVTPENPAVPGETLVLYLTGLGTVTPPVGDGAPGPSNPPSNADEAIGIGVDIYDHSGVISVANVGFAGLAPGYPGVYQINFMVPNGVASGMGYVDVSTNEAYTTEAKLFIQ
jgi:uncharacterized protein (TIGR03437 family)